MANPFLPLLAEGRGHTRGTEHNFSHSLFSITKLTEVYKNGQSMHLGSSTKTKNISVTFCSFTGASTIEVKESVQHTHTVSTHYPMGDGGVGMNGVNKTESLRCSD